MIRYQNIKIELMQIPLVDFRRGGPDHKWEQTKFFVLAAICGISSGILSNPALNSREFSLFGIETVLTVTLLGYLPVWGYVKAMHQMSNKMEAEDHVQVNCLVVFIATYSTTVASIIMLN